MKKMEQFAILPQVEEQMEYNQQTPLNYDCIDIKAAVVESYTRSLRNLPCFWQSLANPELGLARQGVTLIPPSSLPLLHQTIHKDPQLAALSKLIQKAIDGEQYIIHFDTAI